MVKNPDSNETTILALDPSLSCTGWAMCSNVVILGMIQPLCLSLGRTGHPQKKILNKGNE